jgi:hypothetical protein
MANLVTWPNVNKQDSNAKKEVNRLKQLVGDDVYSYINCNCIKGRARLIDSLILLDTLGQNSKQAEKLSDPSCLIMAAAVGVEDILLTIAQEIGATVSENSTAGHVYTDNFIENKILVPLNLSAKSNSGMDIRDKLYAIRGFIDAYRNKPLRRSDEPLCDNFYQAEKKMMAILDRLATFIKTLLKNELIEVRKIPTGTTESDIVKMTSRVDIMH